MDLAAQLQRPLERGRAAELRCRLHLARLGRYTEAVAAVHEALPLLQGADQQGERCAVLRTQAIAASEANAFETAIAAANEMVRLARDRDASTALGAAMALAACFERMGDPWQAARVMSNALRVHGHEADSALKLVSHWPTGTWPRPNTSRRWPWHWACWKRWVRMGSSRRPSAPGARPTGPAAPSAL